MAERVLVLGAGGFIGHRLVATLAASGPFTPVAAHRRLEVSGRDNQVASLQLDATDAPSLKRHARGMHAIVNCVTGSAQTIVAGARALAALGHDADAPHIVHLSSMAVYGRAAGVASESAPLRGDLGDYSLAKIEAERILRSCQRLTILRPGIVYGPGSPWWSVRIASLLVARRLGDLGASGTGICNLLHVDDAAAAIRQALLRPRPTALSADTAGEFNLAMSTPPTWNEYFHCYAEALGVGPPAAIAPARLRAELWLLAPALRALEASRIAPGLAARHPAIRPWLLDLCRQALALDVRSAESQLGMRWMPLAEGLRQTAEWFLGRR